jgi:hypothetical protein
MARGRVEADSDDSDASRRGGADAPLTKGLIMERSPAIGGNTPLGENLNHASQPAAGPRFDGAAQTAHQAVDKVAGKANAQVDRLSGTAHRLVSGTADAANSAAELASTLPEQAKEVQTKFTESACAAIRTRPISAVAGAVVAGYLLGRLARF